MINEDRKKLYDALSSEYDLGTYEEFERNIGDSVKRKKLYDAASADYDLGDFESYSQRIGPTHKESLDAFMAEHGSWLNDFEARDSAETKKMVASSRSGLYMPSENAISGEERERYMELHKQEEALKKAWFTSDEYLAQKDADALFLSNVQKDFSRQRVEYAQANPPIKQEGLFQINPYAVRGVEADTELERFATASRLMDDAIKMHNAPSRYDDKNVFLKFGKGAGDVLSDADFWTAGLTEIADNLGVRDVLSSVQEKLGNLNDLSEEAIENILSPAEKAVLQAWAINTQEQLKRKDDLSRAYKAGQGATESLGFMAEFALTGGIGKAATEGVEQMVKWLGKKALTKVGGMTDDVAAKVLKETGEKIAQSTVGKYGVGLAESLAEAAGRTGVMPSTFRNISEKATEIETDENGNNYLVKMNDAFAKGYVDSFIENLSEGGRVNALGTLFGDVAGKIPAYKKMVDKFSHTKASELWDAFNSSGVMNTLRAGGWHGLGEEYLEEWYGNALRTLTGVDKEALKDFATVDNQIVTLTSFLPMTIFGGTVSTAQVLSANKDLEKKAAALKSALMERGYDEAQANNMIDMMRGAAPAEVSETLTPIVNSVANRNTNEAAALMKPVGEFAAAVQRWQSFNTKYNYQEQEQRDGLRAQMEENLGQFWQQDENGRQTVQRGVNEKGEVVYMLGKPSVEDVEAGVTSEVAAVTSDGRKVFVNPSEYQLEDELEMNTFLGNEIMAEKGNQEQARMIEEKEAKIAAIRESAVPGTAVNIGTAEAPMQAIVLQRNPDGVIVNTPDGQTRQMTYEEFGNYVGVNAVPMTDAQIDEHEADVLTADRAQREAALDQEYDNDDAALDELAEAEDEIEQAVDSNIPLPMKADGSVDQNALWNNDPERWAQWNDEQRQDGGANSLGYINGAIAKESAALAQMQAAYEAEADFDARDAMEAEINKKKDRLNQLTTLQNQYVAAQQAAAAPAVEEAPVQEETVAPRVSQQMSEEEKAQMDTQHQARLEKAKSTAAKREAMQAYINEISQGSVPMTLISMDGYEQVMKDAGCTPNQITQVKAGIMNAKRRGQTIPAFYVPRVGIFAFIENIPNIEQLRLTYVHERQHRFTSQDNRFLNAILNLGLSRERLAEIVEALAGTDFYSMFDAQTLADEIISYAMERAYTYEDFSVALHELGVEQEIIDIITQIDNEQRSDNTTYSSRRRRRSNLHDNTGRQGNRAEDDRNPEAVSGGLLGQQGNRPLDDSFGRARSTGEGAEVNPAFVEAISTDEQDAEFSQLLDDKSFETPRAEDGFEPDDVRFSMVKEPEIRQSTQDYYDKHYKGGKLSASDKKRVPLNITHFTQELLDAANAQIQELWEHMRPYLDMENKGKRFLPAEVYGQSTLFDNASYGKTMENTLICTRTLAYIDFVEEVKKRIGRPLTATESFLASQMLYDIAIDPQCLYCYVSLDRKAYDEFLLRYVQQRDEVIGKWNESDKSAEAKEALYKEFLNGRKPTSQMQARFESWLLLADEGNSITLEDLATKARRGELKVGEISEAWLKASEKYKKLKGDKKLAYAASEEYQSALWGYLASPVGQVTDAEAYAQSASWAKKEEDYRSYTGELLKCSADALRGLMGHYGLRFYSFSEYSPAFILENMQMVRDAAARGLKGFAYTKEVDFIKIFAPTGMNINCSVYGRVDSEGNVVPDTKQGADWEQVQALREQYPNVGAVFVATNDSMVEWALNQPWIDVIIPFHIVRTGADIAKFYDWTNYSSMQADVTAEGKSKYIFPHEHHNDKETFLALAAERGYKPRFADVKLSDGRSIVEHPNYMRLVNETRRSVDKTPILTPTFNTEAAKESFDAFVEKGGYYSGYFVEEGAFEEGIETVVEDIKAGRTAKDVNYGRQDVPIDVAKIMAKRAEIERKHGKSIDLVSEAEKAFENDVMMRVIGEVGAQRMDAAVEATTLMDNLAIAREMEEAGKDAKTIKMATGWERGADNKWRLEMEDFEFKAKPGKKKTFKLGELIADEALFAAYPELANVKVKYTKLGKTKGGQVDTEDGVSVIKINEDQYKAQNPVILKAIEDFQKNHPEIAEIVQQRRQFSMTPEQKEIYVNELKKVFLENEPYINELGGKGTLIHEIQHIIQHIEGFAQGGNSSMTDTTDPAVREEVETLERVLNIEIDNANDLVPVLKDIFARGKAAELAGDRQTALALRTEYDQKRAEWDNHSANINAIKKDLRKFKALGYEGYRKLAGEVEARNAEQRMNMSYEERRSTLLSETEDVAREDQIFLRDNVMMKADEYQASQELVPGHVKGQSMMSEGFDTVSFRITKNTKATIESWCRKANLEQDYTDAIIAYLDNTFEDTTEQLCAARWYLDGKISLPDEDEYKVRDAVKVAKQNKVDALSFSSPMEILDRFGAPKTKAKPINPDTVKEFSNKTELPEGIVVYDVQDDFEGQEAVRKIIDTHWGEEANPWCLAARIDGSLERAKGYWQHYSRYPKRIAFRNGKLLAFFASADKKTWWDRLDSPHENIPYSVKSKEGEYEVSINYELKEGNKKGTQVSVGKSDGKGKTAYFVKGRLDSAGIQDGQRNLFYSSFPAGATLTDSVYGPGNSIEVQYGPLKNVTQISVERRPKEGPASYTRVGYNQNGVRNISFLDGTRSWDIRFGLNGDHIIVGRADLIFDQMGELDSVYSGAYSMNRTDDGRYEFRRGAKGLGTVAKGEKVTMEMLREFGEDGAPVGALLDFVNGMGWDRADYPYANPADADILRNDAEVREMVQKAENDINEVAGKRYLATVNDVRFRFTPRSEEQRAQLFETAKAKYGTTNNFNATGYMLPDGSLLDFSESNDGGDPNHRSLDHRDVEGIIMDEGREYELRYNYVTDFVAEGAIRMLPEYAGFQLSVPPTKEQRSRLMDYIYKHNGEVIMEITDQDGSPRVYMEYNKRTSPSRIFKDMDEFFNNGTTPGLPPLRFRVTPEQDKAYMDAVEAGDMEAAQGMVYDAARAAGYNSPRLYHGTDAEFTTFDKEFNDPGSEGFFFTNSEEMAASYGKNIKQVYLHVEDPYVIEGNGRNWNQLHTDIFSVIPEIEDQIRVHEIAMKSFLDRGKITQEQYDHFREKYYDKVNFIKDESKDSIFDVIKKYIYRWQIRNFKSMLNVERTRDFEWFLQQLDSDVNIIFKDITDFGPNTADFYIARDVAHDVYVTTNPKNIKSADAVTYDDEGKVIPLSERFNPESSDIRFRVSNYNQAIFVSNAAKVVEGIKQEKATPEQWLKMIEKNGGLKAGEDKWMGLSDFLKASDKKTLTKQEVLDFINENMIIIEEQHYSSAGVREEADRILNERYPGWEDAFSFDWDPFMEEPHSDIYDEVKAARLYNETHEDQVETDEYGDIINDADYDKVEEFGAELAGIWYGRGKENTVREINGIREDYTTAGLENNHEIALTVPTIKPWNIHDETHFGDAGGGRAIAWIRFGETYKYMGAVEAREKLQEFVNGLREKYGIEEEAVITQFGNANLPDELVDAISNEELYEFQELQAQSMAATDKTEKRILVIDEIQSKRHQEGRDKGYADIRVKKAISAAQKEWEQKEKELEEYKKSLDQKYGVPTTLKSPNATKEEIKQLKQLRAEAKAAREKWVEARDQEGAYGIPDAPFDKNWSELAMKRMLRYAAENGFDFVAWTKGDQQIERYRLAKDIKRIAAYRPTNSEKKVVNLYYRGEFGEDSMQLIVNPEGKIEMGYAQGSQLADVVGKDNAMKIMEATEDLSLEGDGLRVGGEGMRGFYDKMLPSFMNKYGKKWGVKVEDLELPNLGKSGYTMHSVPVTEEMKASVMEGQVMFRTIAITPEVQEEMDAISASAIVRGNYLKAPNGADTNLTPEQWAMVRTKAFKAWFGEWEKAARINKLRNSEPVVMTGNEFEGKYELNRESAQKYILDELRDTYTISDTKERIKIVKKGAKKVTSHSMGNDAHMRSIAIIPEIIKSAIFITEMPADKADSQYDSYRYYVCGLEYAGESYTVKMTVGVKNGDYYYDHTLTDIEKGKLLDMIESQQGVSREGFTPTENESEPSYALSDIKDKKLVSILQTNSSKVVDANGEPKVVYHQTNAVVYINRETGENWDELGWKEKMEWDERDDWEDYWEEQDFNTFSRVNARTTNEFDGFFFAPEYDENHEYGDRTIAAFVNIKNPASREDYHIDSRYNDAGSNERIRLQEAGFDGVIRMDGDNVDEYIAFEPNQIKSATDNTGEFSTEDKDIRYRVMSDVNTNPTEAQKKAGNYKKGHIRLDGYNITIENPKGSVRRGTDSKGNAWENTLNNDYGYIRGTEGVDGDHIDVYLSDNPTEGNVFVIDQVNPETREFDEHKVMYGFNSAEEAREAYLANFSEGWNGLGTITEVSKDEFKKWIESSHRKTKPFSEYKSVRANEMQATDESELRYRVVSDQETLDRLSSEPTIKVYRAMQLIDGKLYPPMSAKVDGELRQPIELGQWEEAEERPDLVDEKGRFKLDKGNKSSLKARYNPYFHTSPTPLNDQFSSAQTRPELVTVEVEVPESELTSGYKAEKAKDSVGKMEWKAGVVQSKLSGTRTVILSRWDKPVRIVPDSEVADVIVDMFEGRDITMPSNVVTPSLRAELEKRGVPFVETDNQGNPVEEVSFRVTGTPTDEVVANGLQLTPAQTAEVAANIFAALPEESRKRITEGLNGNILGLKDAILQIPTSLASKENWNEEDKQMAAVVAEEMTKIAGEMTRPFSAEEGLWLLYNNLNKKTDLISQASRALVQRNLGFDAETLAKQEQAKEDVRFRTVGDANSNAQASLYNRGAVNVWTRLKESFVDRQASVEELVKAIEKRTGKVAQGFENILLALNQQSSKGLAAMESYTQKFLNPMFDEIRRIMDETKMKYEDVVRYVILKHGLERNKKLAQRDARAHYQEIYDDIISKITGMTAAQKRTYLTNAQLKEGDAKAELATLQAVDMSAMTDEEKREHKKKLAAARKAVEEAEEYLKRAQKVASLSEQEAQDELDKIFEKIENGTDSVFKEMRKNDYSGISSMFYDQLGVDRKNFSTEEQYQAALMEAKKDRYSSLKDIEAAAEAEVKSFEGKTDTKELWKRINAATKETLRQQYEANMISKDQYLNLRDMFEYYVPLRGFKDNTAEDMYTYYRKPNSTGYTKPILGAEGRKTEAESPFGWIASMAGSAIASNVKNEAKLALYYFVSNRPENGIATISKTWFVHTPGDVDANGKKIFRPAYPPFSEDLSSAEGKAQYEIWQANMKELQKKGQAYEAGQRLNLGNAVVNISDANKPEHIVNVKVGGKDYTIIINGNPRAAQAINGDLNIEGTAQDYSALFGPVLRWMSSVNTSYNPEFWITNMMRDMAFTMMAVNIKEDPAYRRKFKKNYLKAFKVISLAAKNEKGTIGDSYLEQQYKDFVEYGGVTGYTQIKDSETWEHEIENYLSSSDPESLKNGKVMRGMKSAFHAAHRFGESLEQVSRFAAFLTARETGKSINEAIDDAKEITVNFNRKGSGKMITLEEAKYLTGKNGQSLTKPQQWMVVGLSSIAPLGRRFIMFFNAAIQGLNATYKLMKKNPKRFTGWALGYAAVGMMNAVLHAMLDDDDDYLDIPQYERRNSLMIGGNGAYFKWALPQEARAFYALGDLAVETVMGRNPHQNFLGEALKIGTEILPVNPSEGWKAFMPSVAIPFIELALNEDYKGAPIYNEQKWLSEEEKERTAKWSNAYQGTGWTYVKIAQGLNFITGGDKHDAGWINLQPEKLEHLVQSAFGGTIRTADKFINTISAALDPEEPMTIRQTPFLNRFLTINDERFKNVHVNDVFDYYKADAEHALTLEKQYIKDRDMDSLTKLRSSDEYQWAKIYGKYKKSLKAIQDKIKVADGTAEKKGLMKQQDELKKRMIKEISEL